jgi:hypothetical protein
MGMQVKTIDQLTLESSKATINVADLADGVYYLTAQTGKRMFKGEFVKIK